MIVEGSSEDSEKSDEKDRCFMDDIVDPNLIFSYVIIRDKISLKID